MCPQLLAKSVQVTGYGSIIDGNISDARKNALEDAKRVAVEQLLGSFVSSRTETRNFMLASEQIYSTTKGQLDTYKIIEEGAFDDNTFKVIIDAQVDVDVLVSDASKVLTARNWLKKPRIKIIDGNTSDALARGIQGSFTSELSKRLRQAGFTIVSDEQKDTVSASYLVTNNLSAVISEANYQGMNISSNQLMVSTNLSTATTGIIVSNSSEAEDAAGANSLKVLNKLAVKIAYRIAQRISLDVQNTWGKARTYPVKISLLGTDANFLVAIQQSLGVDVIGLSQINLESKTSTQINLLAEYSGWPEQLYDQLNQLSVYQKIPFTVESLQGAHIILGTKN
ncbi:MAG: hypothetical protein ACI9LX_000755 [Paraglaciecola sp.]|jgi:hypothetical protein